MKKGDSFWKPSFLGSILNFGSVHIFTSLTLSLSLYGLNLSQVFDAQLLGAETNLAGGRNPKEINGRCWREGEYVLYELYVYIYICIHIYIYVYIYICISFVC